MPRFEAGNWFVSYMGCLFALEVVHLLDDEFNELFSAHLVGQLGVLIPVEWAVLDIVGGRLESKLGLLRSKAFSHRSDDVVFFYFIN